MSPRRRATDCIRWIRFRPLNGQDLISELRVRGKSLPYPYCADSIAEFYIERGAKPRDVMKKSPIGKSETYRTPELID